MVDVLERVCPECGWDGTLETGGDGEPEDVVWCEACGWDGTVEDLE